VPVYDSLQHVHPTFWGGGGGGGGGGRGPRGGGGGGGGGKGPQLLLRAGSQAVHVKIKISCVLDRLN